MGNKKKPRMSILVRIAIVFLIAKILSVVAITLSANRSMMRRAADEHGEIARAAAEDIRRMIDPSKPILELNKKERDEITEESMEVCKDFGLNYIFIVDIAANGNYTYATVASADDEETEALQETRGFGTVVKKELRPAEESILSGEAEESYQFIDNKFGDVCTYLFPIKDEHGKINGVIGVDADVSKLRTTMKKEQRYVLILESINFIAVYILTLVLIKHFVIGPIVQLSGRMRSFLENKDSGSHTGDKIISDEITDIEESFDKMADDISKYIGEVEELSLEKAKNHTQLEIARRIQCDIIPLRDMVRGNGYDVFGFEEPAREVGGDFYDIFELNDKEVCVIVGDISGKGISAALFMVLVKTIMKHCIKSGRSLASALEYVNREICSSNTQDMFATVFVTVLNTETGVLKYANAGHDHQIILCDEPRHLIPENNMAMGLFSDSVYSDEEILLKDGEGILLFTDGVTETIDKNKKQYGEERLIDTVKSSLASTKGRYEVEILVNSVADSVIEYSAGLKQFDDITCVALIYRDNDEDRLILAPDIASFGKIRQFLLGALGDSEASRARILACEEIFSNIVNYSGTDTIRCILEKVDDTCSVEFIDNGVEFDPVNFIIREKDVLDLDTGGMGIMLARMNSREMIYNRTGGKNHLILKFDIPGMQG